MESEPHLAVAEDGETIVVAWMGTRNRTWLGHGRFIGYRFSTDGGISWNPVRRRVLGPQISVADPVVTNDRFRGGFYLGWLARGESAVYLARASLPSLTFQDPEDVSGPSIGPTPDKPWIAVTGKGTLLVSYVDDDSRGQQSLVIARREVSGEWTHTTVASATSPDQITQPFLCASKSGSRVWLVHGFGRLEQGLQVILRWSDNDAVRWHDDHHTKVSLPDERVAFDPISCVTKDEDLWVLYGVTEDRLLDLETRRFGKLKGVKAVRIRNDDSEIADRFDVLDEQTHGFALHPQIALGGDGVVHVLYYAGSRHGDVKGSLRWTHWRPSEGAFSPSVAVAEPIVFTQEWGGRDWLGDYFGVAATSDSLMVAYVDNSGTESHIAFRKIPLRASR